MGKQVNVLRDFGLMMTGVFMFAAATVLMCAPELIAGQESQPNKFSTRTDVKQRQIRELRVEQATAKAVGIAATDAHLYVVLDDGTVWVKSRTLLSGSGEWTQVKLPGG